MTRRLILDALAELFAEGHALTFSVQDVADRAAVSTATVYRHFPSREDLIAQLYDESSTAGGMGAVADLYSSITEEIEKGGPELDLAAIRSAIDRAFAAFDRSFAFMKGSVTARLATGVQPEMQRARDKAMEESVARLATGEADERRRAAAVIRYLLSSQAWLAMRERFDLDADDAARAIGWAVSLLLDDIRARNRAPGAGGGDHD